MTEPERTAQAGLLSHVLVPVANKEDALRTAGALEPYSPERVTALYVVEKGDGAPDKTPVSVSEEEAERCFAAVRTAFPDAEDHTVYERKIVEAIFDAAAELDASAIAYQSRGGSRLMHFLSGDLSIKLVTQSPLPVIALPRDDAEDD